MATIIHIGLCPGAEASLPTTPSRIGAVLVPSVESAASHFRPHA